jgi:LemA protein
MIALAGRKMTAGKLVVPGVIAVVCAGLAASGFGLVTYYNSIVRAQAYADEARAQVEAVLQRRHDLIPNLVETVKGYTAHEKLTLEKIAEARSKAQAALTKVNRTQAAKESDMDTLAASESQLSHEVRTLYAVVEKYPELKASASFQALQDQLEGTENRISIERQRYNAAVKNYLIGISTFPGNIVAGIFGFGKREFLAEKEDTKTETQLKL